MSNMTLTDALIVLEVAMSDPVLAAYCVQEYRIAPELHLGVDPDNPPEIKDRPQLCLSIGNRSRTGDFSRRSHGILAWCAAKEENKQPSEPWTARIKRLDGLAVLLEETITAALGAARILIVPEPGPEDVITYPILKAHWAFRIELPARL